MKFFAEITQDNQPKNKAEKAGSELLFNINKALIPSEAVRDQLIDDIKEKVTAINKEYPRCGDVGTDIYKVSEADISFRIGFCTTISFKPIIQEF